MQTSAPEPTAASNRRFALGLGLFLLMVAVFYLTTLRPGHEWGDDFSMYIRHAMNLVDGRPYAESGYLYDAANPWLGPRSYPPGYPLLLAPVYMLFGFNLTAMKAEIVLLFVIFLGVFALALRDRVSRPVVVSTVLILALSPYFWDFKDNIMSDIPFLLFLFITLWAIDCAVQAGVPAGVPAEPGSRSLWGAAGIGVLIGLTVSIRSLGLVLLPALFLADLARRRRFSLYPFAAALAAGLLALLQLLLFPGAESYADQLVIEPGVVLNNARLYFNALSSFWSMGFDTALARGVFLATLALALLGFALRVARGIRRRSGVSVFEWFALSYVPVLLVWRSNQGIRFLIPLIPLYILYALEGWQALAASIGSRTAGFRQAARPYGWALFTALPLMVGLLYAYSYSRVNWRPAPYGVLAPDSQALFQYLRAETDPADILVFTKPRALALFTDRVVSGYPNPAVDPYLISIFTNIHAAWVAAAADDDLLNGLIQRSPQHFTQVYANPDFTVYRFNP